MRIQNSINLTNQYQYFRESLLEREADIPLILIDSLSAIPSVVKNIFIQYQPNLAKSFIKDTFYPLLKRSISASIQLNTYKDLIAYLRFESARSFITDFTEEYCPLVKRSILSAMTYIKNNYKNTVIQHRFELSKILIKKNPSHLVSNMEKFALTDEHRFELAKLLIEKDSTYFVDNMNKFDLTGEHRFELSKILIKKNPSDLARNIEKFALTDEHRFELAKLLIEKNSIYFVNNMNKFDLTGEHRFELAKLLIKNENNDQSPYLTQDIVNLNITDKQHRLELAKLLIEKDPVHLIRSNEFSEELKTLMQFSSEEFLCCLSTNRHMVKLQNTGFDNIVNKIYQFINQNLEKPKSSFFIKRLANIDVQISKAKDPETLKRLKTQRRDELLVFSIAEKISKKSLSDQQQDFLITILNYRNKQDSHILAQTFIKNYFSNNAYCMKYEALISKEEQAISNNKQVKHMILPMIFTTLWNVDSSKDLPQKAIKEILRKERKDLRDARGFLPNLLQASIALHKKTDITPEQKLYLLQQALSSAKETKQYKKHLTIINILCSLQDIPSIISNNPNNYEFKEINAYVNEKLQSEIFSFNRPIDNFEKKYFSIEEQMRLPGVLALYINTIRKDHINDEVHIEANRLAETIINGTVTEVRYQTDNNPHLAKLKEKHPKLFDSWKMNPRTQQLDSKGKFSDIDTDNWQDLLLCGTEVTESCQKIDGNTYHNKCLPAYILDGKNRLLAIKDPISGKILARSILRILWNKENDQPVLFQERIYPNNCPKEHEKALDSLAKYRAKELQVDLYTCNSHREDLAPNTEKEFSLISLSSPSPYEYVDVSGGVTNGTFTIRSPSKVYIE